MASHASAVPGSTSPEMNRPVHLFGKGHPHPVQYAHDPTGSPYTPMANTPPPGYANGGSATATNGYSSPYGTAVSHRAHHQSGGQSRPTVETNVPPYGVLSPVSGQPGFHSQHDTPQTTNFVAQQNVLPFNLPPAQYSTTHSAVSRDSAPPYAATTAADYSDSAHNHSSEMMMLDQMAMPGTVPVFGDGGLNKSPYVGMPEDFMAYLFNSPPGDGSGSPMSQVMPTPYAK